MDEESEESQEVAEVGFAYLQVSRRAPAPERLCRLPLGS